MRPYLDKTAPEVWKAAQAFSTTVAAEAAARGITAPEGELIKVRASQLNGCAFCLDLHTRQARSAGVTEQQLDMLPIWRDTELFSEREIAMLLIAEATTLTPLDDHAIADLEDARAVLGDETFAAAEWIAVAINTFNRVSIMSAHPVRDRRSA
ncbi:carboxymuconolactone decarboxylase family protein [Leucobacter chinensis]|uniref:carboxymuconolactone decarboxylase family protein n=1 Tax=Leucobacter chinensis TaxID=2851010 RepID=UPI001C24E187|nr:carboxymuconolactone decarboxylase family protein [Leucobacter chinensis]